MAVAPEGVRTAAKRALSWVDEGYGGNGLTRGAKVRANNLIAGKDISQETLARMRSFFARHGVNRTKFHPIKDGKPSPWRVAWDLWGGDAGRTWAESQKR
jgi:hypothetical protein